ncbi:TIGR03086 family metal-binding protein [Geodermatophilus obscurus]|uniref:TIGR03086 family metal-binding protein n=1 Tax=Geodermatophilus obscurus TaxID=1861 RepID=UPI00093549FA|nr:TIGR03086 family metal-binding protein [Geodermatophilus obscurus]
MSGTVALPLTAEVALFVRAAGFALESLAEVPDADLGRPTPCGDWDLRALLLHLADTADGLTGLARTGELVLPSAPRTDDADPAAVARDRLLRLLGVLTSAAADDPPGAADRAAHALAAARGGAIELAVHGWDVATACGSRRVMALRLATALLQAATSLVADGARPGAFAAPVAPPPDAGPEERLVAFLGRRPAARPHRGSRAPRR